jgi:hypothetical protein
MFFGCACCVLSGRGLRDDLNTLPEESYRLWRVVVCDQETWWTRGPLPALGCRAREKKLYCTGGYAVVQLVEALRYKSEDHGFNSRWCHWNFSLIYSFRPQCGPGVDSASNINEYQKYFLGVKAAVA